MIKSEDDANLILINGIKIILFCTLYFKKRLEYDINWLRWYIIFNYIYNRAIWILWKNIIKLGKKLLQWKWKIKN